MRRTGMLVAVALWLLMFPTGPTLAEMVGYRFEIGPTEAGREFYVKLTNQSTSADITEFTLEIFHPDYIFDDVGYEVPGAVTSFTLVTPDRVDGSVRSSSVTYTFSTSGFDPGEVFQFEPDTDSDSQWGWLNTLNDYQVFMFNNGAYANAQLTVVFSTSQTLSASLPDYATASPHIFSQPETIPLPGAVWLLGSSLLSLGSLGLRHRPSAIAPGIVQ